MKGISTLLALALLACSAFAQLPFHALDSNFQTGFGSAAATFGPVTAISSQGIVTLYVFNGTHVLPLGFVTGNLDNENFGASVALGPTSDQVHLSIAVGAPSVTTKGTGHVYLFTLNTQTGQTSVDGNITDPFSTDAQLFGSQVAFTIADLAQPVQIQGAWLAVSNPGSATVIIFDMLNLQGSVPFFYTGATGFGSTLYGFTGYPIVIAASPNDSQGGSITAFSLCLSGPCKDSFVNVTTVPNPAPQALKNFGSAVAVTTDSDTFSLAVKAVVAISTSNGVVVLLSCGLSFTCTQLAQLTYPGSGGGGYPAFGSALAAGNTYLYIGAYNVTHTTSNDGEIFPYSVAGSVVVRQNVWVVSGSKNLGKVLSANMGSPIVIAGADTTVANPFAYLFGFNATTPVPTTAPTVAPTTAAPTTHSGAALNTASFLLVALFLLAHFF